MSTKAFTDFGATAVLNRIFNKTAFPDTDDYTIWVGLCTSGDGAITDLSTLASADEIAAASYDRVESTSGGNWGTASGAQLTNDQIVEFTVAAQSWCTVFGFGLWDASAAGNLLFCATLTTARDVTTNDSCRFAAGALDVSLD